MRFSPQLVRSARPEKPNRRKRFKPFYGARKLGLAHVRFGETSKCALPDFCETDSADPAYSFCTRQAPRLVPHFVGYQTACQGGALPPWTPDHLTTSFSILNLVHLFQNLFTGRFLKMHGGKRRRWAKIFRKEKSSCMAQQRKKLCCEKPLKSFAKNQN